MKHSLKFYLGFLVLIFLSLITIGNVDFYIKSAFFFLALSLPALVTYILLHDNKHQYSCKMDVWPVQRMAFGLGFFSGLLAIGSTIAHFSALAGIAFIASSGIYSYQFATKLSLIDDKDDDAKE